MLSSRVQAWWWVPELGWASAALLGFTGALATGGAGGPRWLEVAGYLLCYLAGGWEPARAGLRALVRGHLDVDLLMVVAAVVASAVGQVRDGGLLVVIFATSGAVEAAMTRRTAASVRALLDFAPARAVRLDGAGGEQVVPAAQLQVGDVVLVRPGERVPADGRVVCGESEVDQSTLTGEPLPVRRAEGDSVLAGTLNGTGLLTVRVQRDPAGSVLARVAAQVEEASQAKATTQLWVERIEQRYSAGVVAVTVALVSLPVLFGEPFRPTLLRAMTFMIVASPCAVVLATMPPLLAAIATAGRHGVLVKSAVVLERLAGVDVVALDKTGTLTRGAPRVQQVRPLAGHHPDAVLALAAAVERGSEHPAGRAVAAAAATCGLVAATASDFRSSPGRGVSGRVDGVAVQVGHPVLLPPGAAGDAGRGQVRLVEAEGHSPVVVLAAGAPVGVLGLADTVRPDAARAVAALSRLTATPPVLLTGDGRAAAEHLAGEVGIRVVLAGLLPQDKTAAVHRLRAAGRRVLLVGDGVNDAPALVAADVGVAMGASGSDLAVQAADAVVVSDDLGALPALLALSRRARRLVVANVVVALAVICTLAGWDLLGHLPLPLGVAGHEGSTVLVGLNGARLLARRAWGRGVPGTRR